MEGNPMNLIKNPWPYNPEHTRVHILRGRVP